MGKKKNKLVRRWGINDVDYNIILTDRTGGSKVQVWLCPYYKKWCNMIARGFGNIYPTYGDCTIYEDWRYLSNFIKWVDSQPNKDWQHCELDKDLLVSGNKHYSPDTAVFIPKKINIFITDRAKSRGDYMLGVSRVRDSKKNPYMAQCRNPFTGKQEYLGSLPSEIDAHKVWQTKKHEYACLLADLQEDERVAKALRWRYAPDKDWTNV